MRKLGSSREIVAGKVYNCVYVGSNEAYGAINGKRTFLVLKTTPVLECVQLFDRFGCPASDDLRSAVCTFTNLDVAFAEDEIFEVENEGEWFKHSAKVTSLTQAIEQDFLTPQKIKEYSGLHSSSSFTPIFKKEGLIGVYAGFSVEGETKQPYLQRVYLWWKTWEQMYADFAQFGVNVK